MNIAVAGTCAAIGRIRTGKGGRGRARRLPPQGMDEPLTRSARLERSASALAFGGRLSLSTSQQPPPRARLNKKPRRCAREAR